MIEHVVIVGGGIAGAAAALALRRAGIAATVLERQPSVGGGAVVRVNPNGMDALRAIGAHQPVIANSFPLLRFEWYTPTGRTGYRMTADPSAERGMPRVMAWAHLAQTLHNEANRAGAVFRYDAHIRQVRETPHEVRAVLSDGDTVAGDVLVGADGARSTVRQHVDPRTTGPERTGRRTIYGFTPTPTFEPPPPEVLRSYIDSGFLAATRDAFTGGCYWFTTLPAPHPLELGEATDVEQWRRQLLEVFGADAVPAADAVRGAETILAFDDYALPSLGRWHSDRTVVIGDAAHVAPPGSEQGAAMAIEDGVVLAQCLRDTTEPTAGLPTFERHRRARAEAVVALGLGNTRGTRTGGLGRLAQRAREIITAPRRRLRLPTAGPAWALEHHIDWNQERR